MVITQKSAYELLLLLQLRRKYVHRTALGSEKKKSDMSRRHTRTVSHIVATRVWPCVELEYSSGPLLSGAA